MSAVTEFNPVHWDLVQFIDKPVEGPFWEWPNNIKDPVLKDKERIEAENKCETAMTSVRCDFDHEHGLWFVHIVLVEIRKTGPLNA